MFVRMFIGNRVAGANDGVGMLNNFPDFRRDDLLGFLLCLYHLGIVVVEGLAICNEAGVKVSVIEFPEKLWREVLGKLQHRPGSPERSGDAFQCRDQFGELTFEKAPSQRTFKKIIGRPPLQGCRLPDAWDHRS